MAKDDPGAITPAAAVARHLEWLEYALQAARDEEVRRRGRLERATDKNRSKRTVRLGEVSAEIRELTALVAGLRALQARAATRSPAKAEAGPPGGGPTPRGRRTAAGGSEAASARPSQRARKVRPAPPSA